MRIAIVDDEKQWREVALYEIQSFYSYNKPMVCEYSCGEDLIQAEEAYDVIFLDVKMRELDGFQTAIQYKKKFPDSIVIMFTMHIELSQQGYVVDAFRYINKMNNSKEIPEALAAVDKLLKCNQKIQVHVVNVGDVLLTVKDILFVETVKRNVRIHTRTQDYITNEKMRNMEALLKPYGFYRSHKSCIVNIDAIDKPDPMHLQMVDGSEAMVSTRNYGALKQKYLNCKYECPNG